VRRRACTSSLLAAAVLVGVVGGGHAGGGAAQAATTDERSVVPYEHAGEPMLFVGDSLCVGARDHGGGLTGALRGAGWEPEYVCGSGEGLEWGLAEVEDLAWVPPVVVVALGTNPNPRDAGFVQLATDLRAALVERGATRIAWVDFADARGRYDDKNTALHEVARQHGDGIVRWSSLVDDHPEWFRSDGLHYQELGMRQWSRRIADETLRLRTTSFPPLDDAAEIVTRSLVPSSD
jgi:lysophospholipase L1-like esterase